MEKAPCRVRGCHNISQLLYTIRGDKGLERWPICYPCLGKIMDEKKDLQYKEFQLTYEFITQR